MSQEKVTKFGLHYTHHFPTRTAFEGFQIMVYKLLNFLGVWR